MKKIIYSAIAASAFFAATGCIEEIDPMTNIVTGDQVDKGTYRCPYVAAGRPVQLLAGKTVPDGLRLSGNVPYTRCNGAGHGVQQLRFIFRVVGVFYNSYLS